VRANNPALVKTFLDHTPLGRTGKPEDIVGPAVFLASEPPTLLARSSWRMAAKGYLGV